MDLSQQVLNGISKERAKEEPRKYIGASSIGEPCRRKLWYGYNGYESTPIDPTLLITFEIGKRLETMILDYLTRAGSFVINKGQFYQASEVLCFQGHIDGMLVTIDESKAVLELKTANDASFNKFKKHGLRKWSETYYAQIQSYMGMSQVAHGVLLAINKNTSALHHEWVDFDPVYYGMLCDKALIISMEPEAPERINESPFHYKCQQCQYRKVCHE